LDALGRSNPVARLLRRRYRALADFKAIPHLARWDAIGRLGSDYSELILSSPDSDSHRGLGILTALVLLESKLSLINCSIHVQPGLTMIYDTAQK
jgi:hypothetical protein